MELSGTATVILGMLAARPRSGYDIKQLVDNSTRFFWAASYGQIYPELKRLEDAGLIEGADASQGARSRTLYKLTAKGRRAAKRWVSSPPEVFEMRDEGLLKLFFADTLDQSRAPEIAREISANSAEVAERLRGLEGEINARVNEGPEYRPDLGSLAVLRFGIEMKEFTADWFERAAGELEAEKKETIA